MTETAQPPRDLIGFFDYYLVQKAPFQLPENVREWLVRFGPWITLVILILLLPVILLALGIGAVLLPFSVVGGAGFGLWWVLSAVQFVLMIMALPGLFSRKLSAWRLLFYSELVYIASALLQGAIVGAIVGGAIGLYILFQIRTKYS